MANIGGLNVKLTATAGGFLGTIARAGQGVRNFARQASESNSAMTAMGSRVSMLTNQMSGLLGVAGGLSGIGALGFGVKAAAEAEQAQVAFEVITGSAEKAQRVIADLEQFAAKTPFTMPGLTAATRKMLAFGSTPAGVIDELRMLGDVSSAVGMDIGELAEIYGKNRVQGRLAMEDINQLTGRGIPIIQELARQFGVAESEVRELVSSGQVHFRHLEVAFQSLTSEGGRFAGMMAKQSKTLSGIWSTLTDNIGIGFRNVAQELLEGLDVKTTIAGLSGQVEGYASALAKAANGALRFVRDHQQAIMSVGKFTAIVVGVPFLIGKVTTALTVLAATATRTWAILAAHPLAAIVLAAGAATYALSQLGTVVIELESAAADHLAQADKLRATDLSHIGRLRDLEKQGRLTAQQQVEAQQIVEKLNSRYGNLNLTFDKTTGRLQGVAAAYQQMTRAMQDQALLETSRRIRELELNLSLLQLEREKWGNWFTDTLGFDLSGRDFDVLAEENLLKTRAAGEELLELKRRFQELMEGGASTDALTGGAASAEAASNRLQQLMEDAEAGVKLRDALEGIQQDAARLGVSEIQIKLADLRELGATNEQLRQAEATLKRLRQAEVDADAASEMRGHLERIQQQVDAMKLDPLTIELKPLMDLRAMQGISDRTRQMLEAQIERYRKLAAERDRLQQDADDRQSAQQIVERNQTMAERAAKEVELARYLAKAGKLSPEQFVRELERIRSELDTSDAGPSNRAPTLMEATTQNIARAMDQLRQVQEGGTGTVDEKQLAVEKQIREELKAIRKAVSKPDAPVPTVTI